ncbi:MAG: hypothetical protein WAT79_17545 [Saprospiraceae bacterium]
MKDKLFFGAKFMVNNSITIKNWAIVILISLVFFSKQISGQVTWIKKHSPNENVHTMHVSSNNILYMGTTSYGIFASSDEGNSWQNISLGLPDSTIRVVQVSSDNKVFIGTGSHGLYQYFNGTWTDINSGLPSGNILVTSFAAGSNGIMYMMNTTGQIYSWNGLTWTNITFNFPTLGKHLTVGPGGLLYAGAFTFGVYVFDNTNNWTLVGNPMPNNFVIKLTVSNSDTIYALCNSNNIFRCPASGGNWTLVNSGLPVGNMSFIATDAQNRVFVAPASGSPAIYRSINGGTSWSVITSSLATTLFSSISFSPSGIMYIGASGVFKSANGGNSWTDVNSGLDAPRSIFCIKSLRNGSLFVGTRAGIWRSLDNGVSWQLKNNGVNHIHALQIMETADGKILFHAFNNVPKGAIYRSVNNGDSWTMVAANGCDLYTKIVQHKTDTLWAINRFGGSTSLSYSINQGQTWQDNPLDVSAIFDIDVSKENTIFIGSESEGVLRSDNGGQTFIIGVGNSIPWYGNVLEVERDENGYIFAGGDWWNNVLWFSTPDGNGNNWTRFTDPDLVVRGVQDVIFDHFNNAYVACEDGGMRMAMNTTWSATTNWIPISSGLSSNTANMYELSFDTSGFMYAIAYTDNGHNGGVYKSTNPVNLSQSSIFTFIGDGLWSDVSNWAYQQKPPTTLSGNKMIIIDPRSGGKCMLDEPIQLYNGAQLKVGPGKIFELSE